MVTSIRTSSDIAAPWKALLSARCVVIATMAALLAACGGGDHPRLSAVHAIKNGDLTPGLAVRHELLGLPRLAELSEREDLRQLVADAPNEFEAQLRVREWAAAQFPAGTPAPYPPWDAMTVLDMIRAGTTGGFCAQYSQVLLQALSALGFRARYVEVGRVDNPYAHFVVEVWSNQYDKWILMDADYNLHFERNGEPLSGLQVHDALVSAQASDVVAVLGKKREGGNSADHWPLKTVELYYYIRVHLKANHLTAPDEPPFDRFADMVEYTDSRTVPWELSAAPSPYPKSVLTANRTADASVFESKLNQTSAVVNGINGDKVTLTLQHNFVEFSRYQHRYVGDDPSSTPWSELVGDVLEWRPTPRRPRVEIRGLNAKGIPGPTALFAADYID